MKYVVHYIKRYIWLFLFGILCLTIEAICDLQGPALIARIVDVGVAKKDLNYVMQTGGLMLAITAIGACAAVTRNHMATRVSQYFGRNMRLDMFVKVQSFSFENADHFSRASFTTRMTNDITQLQ